MKKLYYYKRSNDHWCFSDGEILPAREAIMHLVAKRKEGYEVSRLYLDLNFDFIKQNFFTRDYWEGRTWQEEENE